MYLPIDGLVLGKFPNVKGLVKFNTALPCSAPVKESFSFAGLILSPNCQLMKDELFEALVLAKQTNIKPSICIFIFAKINYLDELSVKFIRKVSLKII